MPYMKKFNHMMLPWVAAFASAVNRADTNLGIFRIRVTCYTIHTLRLSVEKIGRMGKDSKPSLGKPGDRRGVGARLWMARRSGPSRATAPDGRSCLLNP
jgi:hypothetical protein